MLGRHSIAVAAALMLTTALGCSEITPAAPTPSPVSDSSSDGSTLKATAPRLVSPVNDLRLDSLQATLTIANAAGKYSNADFEYRFELYQDDTFVANSCRVPAGAGGGTSWRVPFDLELDRRYKWRARAEMGPHNGPWSDFQLFRSLDYRGIVPRPTGGAWPTSGPAIVDYVARAFPQYLVATPTDDERIANMEFLRDRIIETGVCGGLLLARNLKRGVGPHSIDALAWRDGGAEDEVVDLASAYDDHDVPLRLHWQIVLGPPGYDPYPHPGC
jgi:hypothetical protein